MNSRLTLDYGLRFVNQQPQHDQFGHSANFFTDKWSIGNAPLLYVAGCPGGVNPVPHDPPGDGSADRTAAGLRLRDLASGSWCPASGNPTQGLIQQGQQGISKYGYNWPTIAYAPRFGAAYDVTGRQRLVIRGGGGVFFDRPPSDSVQNLVSNPPFSTRASSCAPCECRTWPPRRAVRVPASQIFAYRVRRRSAFVVPVERRRADGAAVVVVARRDLRRAARVEPAERHRRRGERAEPERGRFRRGVPARRIRIRRSPPTRPLARMPIPPTCSALFAGTATSSSSRARSGARIHSIQTSFKRRFTKGVLAEANWTWTLADNGTTTLQPRYQHAADGTISLRDDWDAYVDLNKDQGTPTHLLRADFVWDLPDLSGGSVRAKRTRGHRQRLAAVGDLLRQFRDALYHRLHVSEWRRQRESDRFARLSRNHSDHR